MKGKLTDDEVIQGIVHAVARAPKGAVLGSMQLVRASGLPYGAKHQATSRARIIRLIPEAVELSAKLYPGRVLSVDRSASWGTYRMVDDLDKAAVAAEIGRMRQAQTKIRRTHTVTSVAKNPAGKMLHSLSGMVSQGLDLLDQLEEMNAESVERGDTAAA